MHTAPHQVRLLAATTLGSILTAVKSSAEVLGPTAELRAVLSNSVDTCYSCPALRPTLLANLSLLLEHFPLPPSTHPEITVLLLHLSRYRTI